LSWFELVPVLSYVFLWGKCRYCKANISLQYPLVELGTALIFTLIYWFYGFSFVSCILLLVSSILIVIFVYDILKYEISDILVFLIGALWLIYLVLNYFLTNHGFQLSTFYFELSTNLYGALALGGFFGLLVLVSKEKWMGTGDIGLGAVIGLIAGWPLVLVAAFLAFSIGSIVGISFMIGKAKKFKDKLPFAPFLILGLWLTLFWGQGIMDWYLSRLY